MESIKTLFKYSGGFVNHLLFAIRLNVSENVFYTIQTTKSIVFCKKWIVVALPATVANDQRKNVHQEMTQACAKMNIAVPMSSLTVR